MVPGFPVVGMRRRLEYTTQIPRPPLTPFGYTLYPKGYRPQDHEPDAHWHSAGSRTRRVHAPAHPRRAAPRGPARRPRLAWRLLQDWTARLWCRGGLAPCRRLREVGGGLPMGCLFGSRAGATRRRKYDHCPAPCAHASRCPCARQRGRGAASSCVRWPPASPRRSTPSTTAMPRPCAAVPPPAPPDLLDDVCHDIRGAGL